MPLMPCVFFDRDGIVNVSPGAGYVERLEDFHIQPAFLRAAVIVRDSGFRMAIATNQRCVARGIVSRETIDAIHAHLAQLLSQQQIPLLGIYCCPHDRGECTCRKPQPGLLLQAAAAHALDLTASWMIGDNETDVEAGLRAGCRSILVNPEARQTQANHVFPDMASLAEHLAAVLQSR